LLHVVLFCSAVFALQIWIVGSHGHVRFRPWMTEDWILGGTVLLGFGLPLRLLVIKLLRPKH
jgi:hypothetical protein